MPKTIATMENTAAASLLKPDGDENVAKLARAYHSPMINGGTLFRVVAKVADGHDYRGRPAKGLIVEPVTGGGTFPFIWEPATFKLAK